jgi:hypothetical protein
MGGKAALLYSVWPAPERPIDQPRFAASARLLRGSARQTRNPAPRPVASMRQLSRNEQAVFRKYAAFVQQNEPDLVEGCSDSGRKPGIV